MYCPKCSHSNPSNAPQCMQCGRDTSYVRDRLFIGHQFIFVAADNEHPLTLKVDDELETHRSRAILSRHAHTVSFGDEAPLPDKTAEQLREELYRLYRRPWSDKLTREAIDRLSKELQERDHRNTPLPNQYQLDSPALHLCAAVTDRKIYRPGEDVALFLVAPQHGGEEAAIEIQLAGNKIYEAKIPLNEAGLALHRYADVREGEYTAILTLPGTDVTAKCTFSTAEFTLSPLIATLESYTYREQRVKFTLRLLLLSQPYAGPIELRLHCPQCAQGESDWSVYRRRNDRRLPTLKLQAKDGLVSGEFELCYHNGPFHIEAITPEGNTATVALPNLGATEREHIPINPLGQTFEMGLAPWEGAQPLRGFYLGAGEVHLTPLTLASVQADTGELQALADLPLVQVALFHPRNGGERIFERENIPRGGMLAFEVDAPYSLFAVGAFVGEKPFEGWGVVIRPVQFEARLILPPVAQPGEEIDVTIELDTPPNNPGAFCWLLAYDARLEHESPIPKLAKRIYESVRQSSQNFEAENVLPASDVHWMPPGLFDQGLIMPGPVMRAASVPTQALAETEVDYAAPPLEVTVAPQVTLAPTRMDFPEVAYIELFYLEGMAARTVKLGDQIGTWRVRAYIFQGTDYRELTADVQAEKPLYAELDLPAIASEGDEITASLNYHTPELAELVIATPYGVTHAEVLGSGAQPFIIRGPGRVEVQLQNPSGSDWTIRDVAWPGVQKVIASRLLILKQNETVRAEKVVVYASVGYVLKDTITALLGYPFG